jgi:hypothetical protein
LRRLPCRQREVIVLRVRLDLDAETVASVLGITRNTVGAHRLAVVVGAALAVPMLAGSTGATPPRSSPALADGSTGSPQLELAAWTVDLLSNKTVRLTLPARLHGRRPT